MKLHHATLEFLRAIKEHNSRKYFAGIRPLYDEIRDNMQEIAASILQQLAKIDNDFTDIKPKECLFRIYRDARRLKDGDLIYKENFGIVLSSGGKKSSLPSYYLHIQGKGNSFFGGGLYRASTEQLYNLRCYLRANGKEYKKIISEKKFKQYFGEIHGTSLTRPPRGFQSYDNYLELIMRKQHLIHSYISDKELLNIDITDRCMERVNASKKRMDFLVTGCLTKPKK